MQNVKIGVDWRS